MSPNDKNIPHSQPIPIEGRRRSGSMSDSSSDSDSASPTSPLQTPASGTLPRVAPVSPSTSPILSYFLSQSPTKSPPSATFPIRRGMGRSFFEDEDSFENEKPIARHGRRASVAGWLGSDRFPQVGPPTAPVPSVPPHQQERAAGLLRRLSLGGNMNNIPPMPVPKPVNTSAQAPRGKMSNTTGMPPSAARKSRRANTMGSGTPRPPRAPSPMGERILKGHFDGFN